jgi:Ca2+-binding EF-hand superfamily protein
MKKVNYITKFVFVVASVQFFMSISVRAEVELIEQLDLDKDGQITIKEAVSNPAILAVFGKIDTDGNGKISSIELKETKVLPKKDKDSSKPDKSLKI